ncbi:MAG: Co2+/Mg2+ efflux protein ApaG [Cellvibrionaceae bacterium]
MNDSISTTKAQKYKKEHPPIKVTVKTSYIPAQSRPVKNRYVYSYTITIKNCGEYNSQLISRHWIIRDALNKIQEVKGDGVIGKQPVLRPGMDYTYTSGAILETQTGTMEGSYQMKADNGEMYEAAIATFVLAPPHAIH